MAKKENSSNSENGSKGQVREGHKTGDFTPRAWQPTEDRTTIPPKGDD
jgi:hypothetical protein